MVSNEVSSENGHDYKIGIRKSACVVIMSYIRPMVMQACPELIARLTHVTN